MSLFVGICCRTAWNHFPDWAESRADLIHFIRNLLPGFSVLNAGLAGISGRSYPLSLAFAAGV